jgi:hypothetical protein
MEKIMNQNTPPAPMPENTIQVVTLHTRRAEAAEDAVLEWLEGQANITWLWIEILISRNGRLDMVENLVRHAHFLENVILVK